MSTKWSAETLGKNGGKPDFGALLKDESRIMLLRGKNVFGDFVYCYIKIAISDLQKLDDAIHGDGSFNLSDFGTILAAGKGEPPPDVKAEIAVAYPTIPPLKSEDTSESGSSGSTGSAPPEKKSWDEY